MAKFPEPPPRGKLLAPDVKTLRRGTTLWRIYFRAGAHPVAWNQFRHWGPAVNMRFDHHTPPPRRQGRGILYGGRRVYTCFAEAFQDARTIERSRNQPWLVGFALARDVALLDLAGTWPTKAGASMAIGSGRRDRARRWSLRIYEDCPDVDGLYYPSSMDSAHPSVALYERARSAMPARPLFHRAIADPAMDPVVATAASLFNYPIQP